MERVPSNQQFKKSYPNKEQRVSKLCFSILSNYVKQTVPVFALMFQIKTPWEKGTCHRFDKATYYFSSVHFPTTIFSPAAMFWLNNS